MAVYQIHVKTSAGTLQALITDFRQMSYTKQVNAPGVLQFELSGNHAAIDGFALGTQVEVWRNDSANGLPWYCDFYGLWRGETRQTDDDGNTYYTATCPDALSMLERSIVAYPAGVANRSQFTSATAEFVMKTLVTRNATSAGTTADGRLRTVTLTGISVPASSGSGNTIDFACPWRNLLTALQDVAAVGGGDFDLVKTGGATWDFMWYTGQRGTDRSATVTFALQYGNMARPSLTRQSLQEKTVAIVAGTGADSSRETAVRTGTNYEATHNATELFVDARELAAGASLNAKGDRALADAERRDELTFDVLQVPSTLYGLHYTLGDLVTGYYQGVTATKKIARVQVSVDGSGAESIQVETENP